MQRLSSDAPPIQRAAYATVSNLTGELSDKVVCIIIQGDMKSEEVKACVATHMQEKIPKLSQIDHDWFELSISKNFKTILADDHISGTIYARIMPITALCLNNKNIVLDPKFTWTIGEILLGCKMPLHHTAVFMPHSTKPLETHLDNKTLLLAVSPRSRGRLLIRPILSEIQVQQIIEYLTLQTDNWKPPNRLDQSESEIYQEVRKTIDNINTCLRVQQSCSLNFLTLKPDTNKPDTKKQLEAALDRLECVYKEHSTAMYDSIMVAVRDHVVWRLFGLAYSNADSASDTYYESLLRKVIAQLDPYLIGIQLTPSAPYTEPSRSHSLNSIIYHNFNKSSGISKKMCLRFLEIYMRSLLPRCIAQRTSEILSAFKTLEQKMIKYNQGSAYKTNWDALDIMQLIINESKHIPADKEGLKPYHIWALLTLIRCFSQEKDDSQREKIIPIIRDMLDMVVYIHSENNDNPEFYKEYIIPALQEVLCVEPDMVTQLAPLFHKYLYPSTILKAWKIIIEKDITYYRTKSQLTNAAQNTRTLFDAANLNKDPQRALVSDLIQRIGNTQPRCRNKEVIVNKKMTLQQIKAAVEISSGSEEVIENKKMPLQQIKADVGISKGIFSNCCRCCCLFGIVYPRRVLHLDDRQAPLLR